MFEGIDDSHIIRVIVHMWETNFLKICLRCYHE